MKRTGLLTILIAMASLASVGGQMAAQTVQTVTPAQPKVKEITPVARPVPFSLAGDVKQQPITFRTVDQMTRKDRSGCGRGVLDQRASRIHRPGVQRGQMELRAGSVPGSAESHSAALHPQQRDGRREHFFGIDSTQWGRPGSYCPNSPQGLFALLSCADQRIDDLGIQSHSRRGTRGHASAVARNSVVLRGPGRRSSRVSADCRGRRESEVPTGHAGQDGNPSPRQCGPVLRRGICNSAANGVDDDLRPQGKTAEGHAQAGGADSIQIGAPGTDGCEGQHGFAGAKHGRSSPQQVILQLA